MVGLYPQPLLLKLLFSVYVILLNNNFFTEVKISENMILTIFIVLNTIGVIIYCIKMYNFGDFNY